MILKGPEEVKKANQKIQDKGLLPNFSCPAKDWDLCLSLDCLEEIKFANNGKVDVLDMGCQGSVVLVNCLKMGLIGKKIGIDFVAVPEEEGITHVVGDITNTNLKDSSFDAITCLSVIEHGVNPHKLFKECSRLLKSKGQLLLSFDYWDPKLHSTETPLGLPWSIFCRQEAEALISTAKRNGLIVANDSGENSFAHIEFDWNVDQPVIYPGYFSPGQYRYTFGFLAFTKA